MSITTDTATEGDLIVRYQITGEDKLRTHVYTVASALQRTIYPMSGGERLVLGLNGVDYVVSYDEEQARGDNGQLAPGYRVGDFTVRAAADDAFLGYFHVSPYRSGDASALSYAAEQASLAIARHRARQSG